MSDPLAHIMKRVRAEDRGHSTPCWIWTGPLHEDGYGRTSVPGLGPRVRIQRATYELTVGQVPDGLVLDHLCRVRECCNPAHLEPVTNAENVRRGAWGPPRYTHCKRGHELTPENRVKKGCRICANERRRQWRIIHGATFNEHRRQMRAAGIWKG